MKAEQKSLTSQFELVDVLINQKQFKEAKKELKALQKKAFDSWAYLGIYRRYKLLGEDTLSENLLIKALKKNSENQELNAVLTKHFIDSGKIDQALDYAKKLKGGAYGSIYSEAVLRKAYNNQGKSEDLFDYFNKEEFYDIYLDAYQGSKNPLWLRNCAVYALTQGQLGLAGNLAPQIFADADDAYFWALVLYDSGNTFESLEAIEYSKRFLQDYKNKNIFKTSLIKQIALESDAYMAISQMEMAEKARQEIILNKDLLNIRKSEENLIPIIYTNSAIWAKNQELNDSCADLLFYVVNYYPDYVPALIQYADFAWESNQERREDDEIKALRKAGLATLEMEEYDNRRKIPLSDAIYRIDESLKRNKNPYLQIKKIDLDYKQKKNLTDKEKNRDLWNLLEVNYDDSPEFRTLLIQYSLNFLLSTKQYDDAWRLYKNYLEEVLTFDEKQTFWDSYISQMKGMELPMVEIGAWFAAYNELESESLRIYEYCVYESGGILDKDMISPYVSTSACMNLANIYYSLGKKEKAIELYGKAAGRESKNTIRSEIYYRIAEIYMALGDSKAALRAADYSRDLFPGNAKAGVLKDKILSK
ncbi:MAG: tetratricopeptide repeat protein [Treponema sp.]|nr:tetratricopeptide repeat protein [Treponema sp.]